MTARITVTATSGAVVRNWGDTDDPPTVEVTVSFAPGDQTWAEEFARDAFDRVLTEINESNQK